jgi:hypothetical protein
LKGVRQRGAVREGEDFQQFLPQMQTPTVGVRCIQVRYLLWHYQIKVTEWASDCYGKVCVSCFLSANSLTLMFVFRQLTIPWIQAEIDLWAEELNESPRWRNKSKVLPHEIPNEIPSKPRDR